MESTFVKVSMATQSFSCVFCDMSKPGRGPNDLSSHKKYPEDKIRISSQRKHW